MEILYELCQKSQAEQDDKLFAHSVFSLFNLIIISHENPSNLLDNIYSQKLFNNTISFEEFIINGCLSCKNVNILNTFCKNLRSLIVNLKKYGEYSLIQFLLNLFKEKCLLFQFLEKIDEKINFFNLFTFLINSSINENQTKNSRWNLENIVIMSWSKHKININLSKILHIFRMSGRLHFRQLSCLIFDNTIGFRRSWWHAFKRETQWPYSPLGSPFLLLIFYFHSY